MFVSILIYSFISLIIGIVATLITGYSHMGCLIKIIIGFIGTLLGYVLVNKFNLPDFFTINIASRNIPLLWSLICATLFVAVVSVFTRRR